MAGAVANTMASTITNSMTGAFANTMASTMTKFNGKYNRRDNVVRVRRESALIDTPWPGSCPDEAYVRRDLKQEMKQK